MGIKFHELGFTKNFAGFDFRELNLTKDFVGIFFREYENFARINFAFSLSNIFSMTIVYGLENNLSRI